MEADALTVLAPIGLESGRGLRVLHDLVDPAADRLHRLEVDPLELDGLLLGRGCRLGVDPHQLGPAVGHHVHLRLSPGHGLGEVDNPLPLPPGLEARDPFEVGRLLIPDADGARRPLEHEQLPRCCGNLGHDLDGGRTCTDDGDALVRQLIHRLGGAATGVAIVPAAGVERVAGEVLDPWDARQLRLVQNPSRQHEELGGQLVAPVRGHGPSPVLLAPLGTGDIGLEQRSWVEIECPSEMLAVFEDF